MPPHRPSNAYIGVNKVAPLKVRGADGPIGPVGSNVLWVRSRRIVSRRIVSVFLRDYKIAQQFVFVAACPALVEVVSYLPQSTREFPPRQFRVHILRDQIEAFRTRDLLFFGCYHFLNPLGEFRLVHVHILYLVARLGEILLGSAKCVDDFIDAETVRFHLVLELAAGVVEEFIHGVPVRIHPLHHHIHGHLIENDQF